jgi:hypothetical protein
MAAAGGQILGGAGSATPLTPAQVRAARLAKLGGGSAPAPVAPTPMETDDAPNAPKSAEAAAAPAQKAAVDTAEAAVAATTEAEEENPVPLPVSSTPSCTKLRTRYHRPNYCEPPTPGYFSDTSNYSTDPTPTKWHCRGIFFNHVPPITPTPIQPLLLSAHSLFGDSSDDDSSSELSLFKDSSDDHATVSTQQLQPPPPAGRKRPNRMQCIYRGHFTPTPIQPLFLPAHDLFDHWTEDDSLTKSSLFKDSSDEHESVSTVDGAGGAETTQPHAMHLSWGAFSSPALG